MFAEKAAAHLVGTVATWPSPQYTEALESARGAFEAATTALGDRVGFFDLNRGSDAEIVQRFVEIARIFDLVILGQTHDAEPVPAKLPDRRSTTAAGRCWSSPMSEPTPTSAHRPLFAWRNSRGAARAVFDALPLLVKDCDALIVEVARKNEPRDEFADHLIANLARTASTRATSTSSSTRSR